MVEKLKILAFQTVIRHFDCTLYKKMDTFMLIFYFMW